jgi:hypothetical protein
VSEENTVAYDEMYRFLETNEGEHDMFKISKIRERRRRDLGVVKFIKSEDGRVLVKEKDIKARWQSYFHNLFNDGKILQEDCEKPISISRQRNIYYCRNITSKEVGRALRKMGRAKAVGPNNILIEGWKCLADGGVRWLIVSSTLYSKPVRCQTNGGVVY